MINAIIFDFDGVIAESVNVKTEAFAEIYRPYGELVVERVVAHHLANGGISRFEKFKLYHKEFLCIDLTEQEVKDLANKFSNLVLEKVISAPYVKGAYEFISKHYRDYDLFISSGTPKDEILKIMKARGLLKFFKGVYGSPERKDKHVKNIMKGNNYKKSEVVFVGDAPSDRDAARVNNISFIARIELKESGLLDEKNRIDDLNNLEMVIINLQYDLS